MTILGPVRAVTPSHEPSLCLRRAVRLAAGVAAVALGLALPAAMPPLSTPATAQTRVAEGGAVLKRIKVTVNKSESIRLDHAFADVLVGSTEIADAIPLTDRTLYVLGKKVGTTNIALYDSQKKLVGVVDVAVGLDTSSLEEKIRESTGSGDLHVRGANDKIVVSGRAHDGQTVERALNVARDLAPGGVVNATRVASPQQVLLKVRFLEASREAGRELGFRWEYLGRRHAARIGTNGSPEVLNNRLPLAIASSAISGNPQFGQILANLVNTNGVNIDLFINALESRGVVRRLAEPNLVAMSGDTANFLAGGEYPVPTNATTVTGVPTITITYKEYGVGLDFTPTVLGNGLINLRVEPVVSELDPNNAVRLAGTAVPALIKRRARTTVELRDGQSFAIAGLLMAQSQRTLEQLPWLSTIPIIGALFRSSEFQQRETELVVVVTPYLVKPAKPGAPFASPLETSLPANDVDFFLGGKPEIQKDYQEFISARTGQGGPYGHMIEPVSGSTARRN